MSERVFVVVSGLPASGKTTFAKALAPELGLAMMDKDDILEGLFDSLGVGDFAWRQKLSRASDAILAKLVEASAGAVIVSFWRHDGIEGASGTPLQWLGEISGAVVEVHCECPPDIAEQRFRSRSRHPGHLDSTRSPEVLKQQFRNLARLGPVNAGPLVTVDAWKPYDISSIARQIMQAARPAKRSGPP